MRITKTEMIQQEVVEKIVCNNCGNDCTVVHNSLDGPFIAGHYGLIEATVEGGYDSPKLADMQTYTFSLCECCLSDMFDKFKIPPEYRK